MFRLALINRSLPLAEILNFSTCRQRVFFQSEDEAVNQGSVVCVHASDLTFMSSAFSRSAPLVEDSCWETENWEPATSWASSSYFTYKERYKAHLPWLKFQKEINNTVWHNVLGKVKKGTLPKSDQELFDVIPLNL